MPYIASMGIYVVSKNVMLDLLRDKFPGANDFGSEVIPGATSIGLRVCFHSYILFCNFYERSIKRGGKDWNSCWYYIIANIFHSKLNKSLCTEKDSILN